MSQFSAPTRRLQKATLTMLALGGAAWGLLTIIAWLFDLETEFDSINPFLFWVYLAGTLLFYTGLALGVVTLVAMLVDRLKRK